MLGSRRKDWYRNLFRIRNLGLGISVHTFSYAFCNKNKNEFTVNLQINRINTRQSTFRKSEEIPRRYLLFWKKGLQ
jgi:hypothetical protein